MKDKIIKVLEGTMKFVGMWDNPILMTTDDGDVDITNIVYGFFATNQGKEAKVVSDRECVSIKLMQSDRIIDYTREFKDEKLHRFGIAMSSYPGSFGWTNTALELEYLFTSLAGRRTILELTDDSMTIRVDKFNDDVPCVFYTHNNSATLVGNYDAKDVCKPGTNDCCIFLSMDQDGFACEKFNGPSARHLLDRHVKGEMRANRIGNCRCGGRWEELRKKKQETQE